ncbi:armadillo-type protein [Infundibulicybe gibba]|nr:armadillo-type protein [Infundibulicybe gibba]
MDLQTLSNLFSTTFNPDPNIRKSAELQIRKVGNEEGVITALLQIISSDSVDLATRQACAVWIKNRVLSYYPVDSSKARADNASIAESDRQALRKHVIPILTISPSRGITLQFAQTLKILVAYDFPERWPELTGEVERMLRSGDIREVHAGCVAALECIRAFRFRTPSDTMPSLIESFFPTLVSIATQMMQTPPTAAQEIPTMLHLILKTYKTSIAINLSKHQQRPESLVPWTHLFFAVVNLRLPAEAVPQDEEERERCEWWKAKKWAYSTLGRLFHRYGNPSQLPSPMQKDYAPFAKHFVTVFAPEIISIFLQQVELYVNNTWLSKKAQYLIFQFFTECVKPKSTWTLLKPHIQTLISSFVFPQLSFNGQKQSLWESDPVDYLRTTIDEYESFATPVSSATTFLLSLATNRTKTTFMPILGFINEVLRSNHLPAQRFGALNMTAALAPWIMRHPEVKGGVEQFLMQYVAPAYSSPEPYMRAIACEVLGTMSKAGITWTNEENLNVHFRAVAAALDDTECPVRVHAALALTELVVIHESVRTAVAPQVGKVIQGTFLLFSDETDLDLLNHSMDIMVEQFQTELLPVAAQLTARLCESYLRLAKESATQDLLDPEAIDMDASAENDKTFAAMGVAKTIGTIVSSIDSSPEILAQVQEVIIPIVLFTFEHKILDLFDDMYDLVDSLTFKLRAISPNMWPVFEQTYALFKSDAVDFLEGKSKMLPSLDNFVSFGSEVIKNRPDYKQMLVDIYTIAISNPQLGENDRVNGSKLAESILLNLRGHVDDALQIIIETALGQLDKSETASLRLANLEVLINAVLYNPSAALHMMENQSGMARTFFDRWFAAIKAEKLPRVHDKKLSILALCALLEMPPNTVPTTLQDGWPGIVGGILSIFKDLPKAIQDRKALEEALQEDSDEDESDDERVLNLTEDDEDVWDEDSAYLELLAKEGARLREKSGGANDIEDDETSEDSDIDEELGYISPLDTVNPYLSFKQALTTFQMQNSPSYQTATTALTIEQQTQLMEVMRIAESQSIQP